MPSFLTAADAVCKRWEMRRFAVLAEVFHWRLGTSQSASPTSRVALYQLYRADDQQAQVHLQACTRDQHQNTLCNNRTWISRVSYIRGVKWLLLLFNAMSAAMVILRPDFMAPSCMVRSSYEYLWQWSNIQSIQKKNQNPWQARTLAQS